MVLMHPDFAQYLDNFLIDGERQKNNTIYSVVHDTSANLPEQTMYFYSHSCYFINHNDSQDTKQKKNVSQLWFKLHY